MPKASPHQIVTEKFGGRSKLVDELAKSIDSLGDDDANTTRSRLMGLSNKKLLRLYGVEQKVRERFGDRAKLVQHIIDARKGAGHTADDAFQEKLKNYSKAQLLDMTRQGYGERPAKQTAEQRMKAKRGKKQRERAAAKA